MDHFLEYRLLKGENNDKVSVFRGVGSIKIMGGQTNNYLCDFQKLWSSPGWVRTIAHLTHFIFTPLQGPGVEYVGNLQLMTYLG